MTTTRNFTNSAVMDWLSQSPELNPIENIYAEHKLKDQDVLLFFLKSSM